MKNLTLFSILGLMVATVFFQSCKKDRNTQMQVKPTLYDSLGGTKMVADPMNSGMQIESGRLLIRNIVDSTIFVVAADPAINFHFATLLGEVGKGDLSGFQDFSETLTDFFAVASGAKNYKYDGLNMVAAHDPAINKRMNGKAANPAFDAFERDLFAGAKKAGVPATTPALISVGKLVESLRGKIVQK